MNIGLLLTIASGIIGGLWSVCILLIGVVYNLQKSKVKRLETLIETMQARLIVLEQENKFRYPQLERDLQELKQYVHDLVHKENNTLTQAQALIKSMFKKLQDYEDKK